MSSVAVVAAAHKGRLERPPDMMMDDLEALRAQSPLMRPRELTSYLLCKYELEDICTVVRTELRAQGFRARPVTEARAYRASHLVSEFIENELVRIARDQSTPENFKAQVTHVVRDPGVSERNTIRDFENADDDFEIADFRLWLVDYVQAAAMVITEQEKRLQTEPPGDSDKLLLVSDNFLREVLGSLSILSLHNDDDQASLPARMSLLEVEQEGLLPNFRGNCITLFGPNGEHDGGYLNAMDPAEKARIHQLILQDDRRDEFALMRDSLPETLEERYEFLIDRRGNIKKGREEILAGETHFRLAVARALVEQFKEAGTLRGFDSTDSASIIDGALAYHELRFRMAQLELSQRVASQPAEKQMIERIYAEVGLGQRSSERLAIMAEDHRVLLECLRQNRESLQQYLS